MALLAGALMCLFSTGTAQQAGTQKEEFHPPLPMQQCNKGSCWDENVKVVLDSARRWVHDARTPEAYENCIKDEGEAAAWDPEMCPNPLECAKNCAVDGVDQDSYTNKYGITPQGDGLKLSDFNTGTNVGARVYVLDNDETYKVFRLKNKEISFDVDVSTLPCGVNAAMYLVQMDPSGQKGVGGNTAGAKFGTGYCDAQCPHQLKFIQGEANMNDWNPADESGHWGSCCAEMDLWEANNQAAAFTAHPCNGGQTRCEGTQCGDAATGEHYMGLCDKDGCDFNTYRLGDKSFYGSTINPMQPLTVVTQFLTTDGTDGGDLAEIRRVYIQNGQVIKNAESQQPGIAGASISDGYCSNMKQAFINTRARNNPQGDFDQFTAKGGLKAMGASLDAGMVLVLSLWDDPASKMRWLDSRTPGAMGPEVPGVSRGPCPRAQGRAEEVESSAAGAFVTYTNVKYGEIGSTHPGLPGGGAAQPAAQPAPVIPETVVLPPMGPDAAYGAGVVDQTGYDAYAGQDPYAGQDAYGAAAAYAGQDAYGGYAGQNVAYGQGVGTSGYGYERKIDDRSGPVASSSKPPLIPTSVAVGVAMLSMVVLAAVAWKRFVYNDTNDIAE